MLWRSRILAIMVSRTTPPRLAGFPAADENGAKVVDVGEGRAGDDEVAGSGKETIAVIVGEPRLGVEAARRGARQAVGPEDRAGIILGAVDPVGIGGQRGDAGESVQRHGEGKEELGVAPAPPLA